ncbi:hypothetical protein RRF57_011752 [Xylaria bambusicola]|uniref:Nephrocystin 3-like N-terminal domain-containing protein n=1 Tax=Xylaria bambusicola TaxID=326684 RepID=A0AAN7UND3_9PEZI
MGLIASSNQVMRNASIRDKLSMEKDVLCFEMEAAGLMNQFPFLIVRGICDYSDTHKNKLWQGYAAMTAAAYTKDLLYEIAPNKVEAERTLVGILSDVLAVSTTVSSINEGFAHTKRYREKKEEAEILDWLTSTDYGTQQTDNFRRRQLGTGQWLLDSDKYQSWLKEPKNTLFCPGIPGAGKTILTSIVIDNLENHFHRETTIAIAYVYLNYKRQSEQTVESLLSSLLKQLCQCRSPLPSSLTELYDRHKPRRTRPSFDEISKALESVTVQNSRTFITIDALDECRAFDGCRTRFLSAIFNLQKKTGVNIFATSRYILEIEDHFRGCLSIEIRATKHDISRYLQGHISELPKIVTSRPELQNEIITSIIEAVDGMYVYSKNNVDHANLANSLRFLLAQLYLASLIGKDTPKAIRKALQKLATGSNAYNTAYKYARLVCSYYPCAWRTLGRATCSIL